MKRKLIIPAFTALLALAMAAPAYAHDGGTIPSGDETTSTVKTVTDSVSKVEDTVKSTTEDTTKSLETQRERIEARTLELQNELKQKKEDRKEKLEGRRLERCQNREATINSLLDKSVTLGRERLTRIQNIEAGVKAFYEKQQLSSTEYDASLQAADEKQAAAVAALNVIDTENFSCDQVDGAKPSDTIHTTNEAKRTALKEYRESVQHLIKVVRQAFVAKQQAAGGSNE
jgi:hypothetical protein